MRTLDFLVLFRTTRITLHCPIHGSSLSNCCWMGCRLFCCKSAWSASRWGWLSIFLTSSFDNPGTLWSWCLFPPPGWTVVYPRVSPFLIIGFLVLVGFVGCPCCFQQLLNLILSSNYLWRKSLEEAEVTHILSRIWFLQISSQQLSRYNKLGVYHKGWLRSILFDRTSILSVQHAVKSSLYGSLWSLFMGFRAVKNTVCLSLPEFCPPGINPEFVMESKLIPHPIW